MKRAKKASRKRAAKPKQKKLKPVHMPLAHVVDVTRQALVKRGMALHITGADAPPKPPKITREQAIESLSNIRDCLADGVYAFVAICKAKDADPYGVAKLAEFLDLVEAETSKLKSEAAS